MDIARIGELLRPFLPREPAPELLQWLHRYLDLLLRWNRRLALWHGSGEWVVAEADGQAYHLSASDWQDDLRRQHALHAAGVVVLRYPVRRLREEPAACAEELRRLVA